MTVPELKEELLAMPREEMARNERERAANKTVFQRVCKGQEDAFNSFNYTKISHGIHNDGKPWESRCEHRMDWKVRSAIGTLLRAVYQVDAVAKLPAEREEDIARFVSGVLALMEEQRKLRGGDHPG